MCYVLDALSGLPETTTQRQRLHKIASTVTSHRLLSQQEAVYTLAHLPLRHSTRLIVFVNARYPANRVRFLKPRQELRAMAPDDADVFKSGVIEKYAKRPRTEEFENMTLAHYAVNFTKCPTVSIYIVLNADTCL